MDPEIQPSNHLQKCLDDRESELQAQVEINADQTQEVMFLREKVARLKEQRKLDKTRTQELQAQVANLQLENMRMERDKERAEAHAEQLRQQILQLETHIKEHDAKFENLRLNHGAQVLEQLETLVNPKFNKNLEEFLKSPATENSEFRIEFETLVATVAQTPSQAAKKFLADHPELEILSEPLQTLADSVLEVLRLKAGIGKFKDIHAQLTSVGVPEDIQIQKDFLACLNRSCNGMVAVAATTIAGDFLENHPIFYFPLPFSQKTALDTIRDKVSQTDWVLVEKQVLSTIHEPDNANKLRRLFHDKVYDFRGNSYRAAKRFVYASGLAFKNWWDYIIPFNFFN